MYKRILSINFDLSILEKIVIVLFLLIPFTLLTSILIAEIFSIIISIIFIFWIFSKKNFYKEFIDVKIPILLILLVYILILVSLIMSNDFNKSFLPSFFYFRYFLLSLGIFYILKNFEICINLLLFSLLSLFTLIILDSFYEFLQIKNLFGLSMEISRFNSDTHYHITSFFNDEKKLGSFIIRLLPLIISLLLFLEIKIFQKIQLINLILIISGIIIFFTSERTALFLFIFFLIFVFKFLHTRIWLFAVLIISIFSVSFTNPKILHKHISATLFQLGIISNKDKFTDAKYDFSNINYLSIEHEKLIKSGFEIFKENPLTGSGIKTYHETCKQIKIRKSLDIVCSTHPHNTYIQILSDTGIITTLIVFFIFCYSLFRNFKIFFMKYTSKNLISFYVLNLGVIINLMPLIPSGSFFNNWINLMIYFPICFWLYLFAKIKKDQTNSK
jgi:O-antigen ligase